MKIWTRKVKINDESIKLFRKFSRDTYFVQLRKESVM